MLDPVVEVTEKNGERSKPSVSEPDVFEYNNYRTFLNDWSNWKRSVSPYFSGAVFAKKAGLQSHTLLGMVIKEKRNLSSGTIRAFAKAVGLSEKAFNYFERLVHFNQAKKSDDKIFYFEQLLGLSRGNGKKLLAKIKDHTRYLSHWYVVAIRELSALDDFKADPEWIANKLKKQITKKEAEEAWNLLLDLGLVSWDAELKKFQNTQPKLDYDDGNVDFAVRNYHKEYLKRSLEAVDGDPLDERELSSLTIALSENEFKLFKEKLNEFRIEMNKSLGTSGEKTTRVVAWNTQIVTLTSKTMEKDGI